MNTIPGLGHDQRKTPRPQCRRCDADVIDLWDEPVGAFKLRAHCTTWTGALLAIVGGRRAVAGTVTKTGTVWHRITADRIPADGSPPTWASVFAAEHDCNANDPPPPPLPPLTVHDADTRPPF